MSLTAFQRYSRMQQVEEMKPENIAKEQKANGEINKIVEEPVIEEVVETEEVVEKEEPKTTTTSNRRRNTRRN